MSTTKPAADCAVGTERISWGKDARTGIDGAPGEVGPTGMAGPTGSPGTAGPTGPAGEPGNDAVAGAQGATGSKGADGANGVDGKKGDPGVPGASGTFDQDPAHPVFAGSVLFIDTQDTVGYLPVAGTAGVDESFTDAAVTMPRAGKFSGLRVFIKSGPATRVDVYVDDRATGLGCEIPAGTASCQDIEHFASVKSSHQVALRVSNSSGQPVENLRFALAFEGS